MGDGIGHIRKPTLVLDAPLARWGGNYEEVVGCILYPSNSFADLVVPGALAVQAQDINNRGIIVGYYQDEVTGAFRSYIGVKNTTH